MRLSLVIVCLISCLGLAANSFAQCSVVLDLPADCPIGLPVVVPGTLIVDPNGCNGAETFELSQFGKQKILAQYDSASRHAWVALTPSREMIGKKVHLAATAIKKRETLRIEKREGGYEFLEGDRSVLFYQSEPMERHDHTRAGFVHPLKGLDGETFTEIFPEDHRHHQGVFWAWHQLWVGDRKIGDPWVTKDHLVAVESVHEVSRGPLLTTLQVEANWISPQLTDDQGKPQPIVGEHTTIRLFKASEKTQYIDFMIFLVPLVPEVKIGGSENVKGYSGFTVRVKPPKDMVIQDADGVREQDAVQTASRWADVSGSFADGKISGVGILSHPSLAQFPPRWLLRHYGMQNVAYPGREPVALSATKALVIRHRLVLHRGNTEEARVADHQRIYELTP
jgi:hypothetical protein